MKTIINSFYFDKETGEINIDDYGVYRMGLTAEEIKIYIQARRRHTKVSKLIKRFYDIAGCNTMAMTPDGRSLMYRHDVKRFADILFGESNSTYFD